MTPTLDQVLVASTIAGAVSYFILRIVRSRKKGCGSDCGCSVSKKPLQP
jgi:hypothetical protein